MPDKDLEIVERARKAVPYIEILKGLTERKIRLVDALEYMRKEAMLNQIIAKPEWKYYFIAIECIEKEYKAVESKIKEICEGEL